MKVLGISPLDKDSTVSLVEDGRILFAAGEERFTRVKLQDGFPWRALEAALECDRDAGRTRSTWSPIRSSMRTSEDAAHRAASRRSARSSRTTDAHGDLGALLGDGRRARAPARRARSTACAHPNERMEKGFAKALAYRVARREGASRATSRASGRGSGPRSAEAFHRKWHEELEPASRSSAWPAS